MKLKKISFYTYNIPLTQPLNMKGYLHTERKGLIVELVDEMDNRGYGDAAPFAGLHQETISDIVKESGEVSMHLYKMDMNNLPLKLEKIVSPSLQFALDWAFLDLTAGSKDTIPAYFLNKESPPQIMINALLAGAADEMIESAKSLKQQDPAFVKIKVANQEVQQDIALVQEINTIFEGQVKLRLDANRSWSLEQAIRFATGVIDCNIEFIEEPVSDPFEQQTVYENSGIRFALDESLTQCSIEDIKGMTGISAFIIKPSVFGSISFIKSWIDFANVMNANVIFSSVFESSIGLWSIAQMAAAYGNNTAHGLNTYRWLKQDIITPSFTPINFQISLPQENIPFILNKELLKPLMV